MTEVKKYPMNYAADEPAKKFCPVCGKEITEGSRFCIGCGSDLSDETTWLNDVYNGPEPPDEDPEPMNLLYGGPEMMGAVYAGPDIMSGVYAGPRKFNALYAAPEPSGKRLLSKIKGKLQK